MRALDDAVAGSVEPFSDPVRGVVISDGRRPLVRENNYVWVEEAGPAAELIALADRLQAGLGHRTIVIPDAHAAAALAPEFTKLGWFSAHYVVMAHRDPGLLVDDARAREVGIPEFEQLRAAVNQERTWRSEGVARQVIDRDRAIAAAIETRSFAAAANGELASYCQLYLGDRVAQVENVVTLRDFRNRGLARAVVSLATATARERADLIFLFADAGDWPQDLYRRVGYDAIGLLHRFCPDLPG